MEQNLTPVSPKSLPPLAGVPEDETYRALGRYAGTLVLEVFAQLGGVPAMTEWARTNPDAFYTKLLPRMMAQPVSSLRGSPPVSLDDVPEASWSE
jgi:hypothetical protein